VVQSGYDFEKYAYVKNKQIIVNPLETKKLLNVTLADKEHLLIAVGSLTPQKGFDMLIEALNLIDMQDWQCLIIGEGAEREKLTQRIKKYQLEDKITLIGQKKNIFDYFKKASIFVLSSRYEGFPNVLNEAMAHGCTSVAFDCKTGPSDMIVHGKNGLIATAENIDDLSKKISEAINNEALRERIFPQALHNRETNSLEKIVTQWEKYIQGVLS
jgi:GalNAc-alpha-(1->4)-GalNAc-alpha-(1->3)-diNAcBac-PP-undecaprenol alpha-1,4-N-acetyl-D-galactosaminyltransferase